MAYLKVFLMRSFFILFIVLHIACSGSEKLVEVSNEAVVAEVNGSNITVDKLRDEIQLLMKQFRVANKNALTEEEKLLLKTKGLNRIIRNILLVMEASSSGISLTQDEYEVAFGEAKSGYEGDSFREFLKDEGIPSKLWQIRLKNNLLIYKLIHTKFKLKLSDDETKAKAYYKAHKESFEIGQMVHAFHIMVASEDESKVVHSAIKAQKKSFSELARMYSLAPEASVGGDLGYFEIDQMPEEFGSIVQLKKNQVSEIIKTPYGYHIFKVVDVKIPRQLSFSESKKNIFKQFARDEQSNNFKKWLIKLKNNSNIKINEDVLSKVSL
ncbi:peptidylprolyl isomerase [Nitrospinaceae bacterium]|nr:peptidylprolyl isomerase [Nitrospinaceae bacterium]